MTYIGRTWLYWRSLTSIGRISLLPAEYDFHWQNVVYTGWLSLLLVECDLYWQNMIYTGLLSLLLAEYAANQKCSAVLLCSADSIYPLVCTRLQHSRNIKSCITSRWKSNMDNKTLLLLKWSLHSIVYRKYKTRGKDISSKVCGCYMARLTLSKNSNSASLTILLYRLFTLLSTDGDNNNAAVIIELLFCFVIMREWYIKSNIFFRSFSYLITEP